MLLYDIISFIVFLIFIYETSILENLGFIVITFGEADVVPWFLEWPLLIWIVITMFISIIIMVKRSARLINHCTMILRR